MLKLIQNWGHYSLKKTWLLVLFLCAISGFCFGGSTSIFFKGGAVFFDQPKINIDHIYGIKLAPLNITARNNDVDTYFPHSIDNMGNTSNKINLEFTYVSDAKGWSAKLIRDDNENGIHEESETTQLDNEQMLSESGTIYFFIKLTRPSDAKSDDSGSARLKASGAVKDGVSYIGYNGTSYGGVDEMETTDTVIVN
jgi:hypothetical protein